MSEQPHGLGLLGLLSVDVFPSSAEPPLLHLSTLKSRQMSPTSGFLLGVPLEPVVYRPAPPLGSVFFSLIFFPFCVCLCTCVCWWRALVDLSAFLSYPSSYFLRQGLLLNMELTDSSRLADQ